MEPVIIDDKPGEQVLGHAAGVNPQNTPQQQPPPDPYEAKARELGWRPETEFDGDKEEWVDAKEFVKRAPLFDRLKTQGRRLKEQEKTLHDLTAHIQKVEDAAYKRAIADLQKEKREAVRDADEERVAAIDQEIAQFQQDMAPPKKVPPPINPAITEWLGKKENQWFNTDKDLQVFAKAAHDNVLMANPGIDIEDSLKEVTKMVKRAFPEKFTNPARAAAPSVETGGKSGGDGKKVYTFRDLSDEQKQIASRFERQGIMKKDDYVKQLAESGQIGG